jgi:hypothetical protein
MHHSDLTQFTAVLSGTMDALGGRTLSEQGVKSWWEALKGFPASDVIGALDWWARHKSKPPAPADIHDWLTESAIKRREAENEQARRDEHNAPYAMGATPGGRAALKRLLGLVSGWKRPTKGTSHGWAKRIVQRYGDGHDTLHDEPGIAPLTDATIAAACSVLNLDRAQLREQHLAAKLPQSVRTRKREDIEVPF